MNILFLTIGNVNNLEEKGIYTDLLRILSNKGHSIYIVSPYERRTGLKTAAFHENSIHRLHVSIGNITKCGFIEKGISTLQIERKFLKAIKKFYKDVKFDLVLYSTPPITFASVIEYVKKRDNARSYLILKDIFPQNAVDIGLLSKRGMKGILYNYFRNKERKLYAISDKIGCMSDANVNYILNNNPEIPNRKVGICPNCIEVHDMHISNIEKIEIRNKYKLPLEKKIFVYGGNLGRPQGIPFIIECLEKVKHLKDVYFLIIGNGTEYKKLHEYIASSDNNNVKLMRRIAKEDYDKLVAACDVGLIFLDYRFTIPNFPSRILSYMQAGIPVIAATDINTDIGNIICNGEFGWRCESNSSEQFLECVCFALSADLKNMGNKGYQYLKNNYPIEVAYNKIICED